jgi:predicted PurR-regulated permease PerM
MSSGMNEPSRSAGKSEIAATAVLAALAITALYVAQAVFVPLAIATLLAFVLSPPLLLLQRAYVPRAIAVVVVVGGLLLAVTAAGGVVSKQLTSIVQDFPKYETVIRDKLSWLRAITSPDIYIGGSFKELQAELSGSPGTRPDDPASLATPRTPVPVELRQRPPTIWEQVKTFGGYAFSFLFLIFILLEREDLRDRFIRVLGTQDLERTTQALNDTTSRLSRFLFTLTALNIGFGLLIAAGVWLIGIPGAALWGMLATVMRFVPFIGSWIAAAPPVLLAAAVDPGWNMVIWTVALYAVAEPLMGHIVEPLVHGKVTGLSPFAIVVAAAFWTLLWGPVGLLLATPLTLILVSLGRHFEPLGRLEFILGDTPPLTPAEQFYQRILAGNTKEAVTQSVEAIKIGGAIHFYDDVVRSVLNRVVEDDAQHLFDEERIREVAVTIGQWADDMAKPVADLAVEANPPPIIVMCLRTPVDEAAARVFASLLTLENMNARVVNIGDEHQQMEAGQALVLGALTSPKPLIFSIREVQTRFPQVHLVPAWWGSRDPEGLVPGGANVAHGFGEALLACKYPGTSHAKSVAEFSAS